MTDWSPTVRSTIASWLCPAPTPPCRCLTLITENPDEAADWDLAFAHEALARAAAATSDAASGSTHRARAEQIAAEVSNPEDRAVITAELAREPWFGLLSVTG